MKRKKEHSPESGDQDKELKGYEIRKKKCWKLDIIIALNINHIKL